MDNFTKIFIQEMARRNGTDLTADHLAILTFAYEHYQSHRVGPLFQKIKKHTGLDQNQIKALFPHGLSSVYTWVGIPVQSPDMHCKPMVELSVPDFREVFLDYNATTPVRKEVGQLLHEYYDGVFGHGNPSSSTKLGHIAYTQLHKARAILGEILATDPNEIIFTSCGSESNNMAIKGILMPRLKSGGHIITSAIEHASVLAPIRFFQSEGFRVTLLQHDRNGAVTVDQVAQAIQPGTALVSIMAVNNELGTINPIQQIGQLCRDAKVPFFVDGIQALGKIDLQPKRDCIDMLSFSGHKMYAPKGIAGLYVNKEMTLSPLIHGGGQEGGLRSGTENVAFAMALAQASRLLHQDMEKEAGRLTQLRDYFLGQLQQHIADWQLNGGLANRLPNNLNIGFRGVDSGSLLLSLNQIGVYVSSGSACKAGSQEASHVLKAIGCETEHYGSIRFSFGLETRQEDIDYLFRYLPHILEQLRQNHQR